MALAGARPSPPQLKDIMDKPKRVEANITQEEWYIKFMTHLMDMEDNDVKKEVLSWIPEDLNKGK